MEPKWPEDFLALHTLSMTIMPGISSAHSTPFGRNGTARMDEMAGERRKACCAARLRLSTNRFATLALSAGSGPENRDEWTGKAEAKNRLIAVPGVAHSNKGMADRAVELVAEGIK